MQDKVELLEYDNQKSKECSQTKITILSLLFFEIFKLPQSGGDIAILPVIC